MWRPTCIILAAAVVCTAHADLLAPESQTRFVEAEMDYYDQGQQILYDRKDASDFGPFDEGVDLSFGSYQVTANQTSTIGEKVIACAGSVYATKPFFGTHTHAEEARTHFAVGFELLQPVDLLFNGTLDYWADTGGIVAGGVLTYTLEGDSGAILSGSQSYPITTGGSFTYNESRLLDPGTYSLTVLADIYLSSGIDDVGGGTFATFDFQFVLPEPNGLVLMSLAFALTVARWRR